MTDEARVDAVPRIDRRLHREQAQHAVGAAADLSARDSRQAQTEGLT
jgi:hypothetical protein